MKKNNKKGFTIVELVIVIAVIAILSAVLIPTFGGIVDEAMATARDQEAKNLLTEYLVANKGTTPKKDGHTYTIYVDGYYYTVAEGNIDLDGETNDVSELEGTVVVIIHNEDCLDPAGANHDGKCDICDAAVECAIEDCETHAE